MWFSSTVQVSFSCTGNKLLLSSPLSPAQIANSAVALETTTVCHDCESWAVTGAVKPGGNAVSGMVWVCREEGAFGKVVSAGCLASALQMQFRI